MTAAIAPPWQPDRGVEIVTGTPPGGSLDRAARALVLALGAAHEPSAPVSVRNVPGDGSRKAWAYMDERVGDPHVLAISHPNLATDRLLGLASFDLRSYTPIAILYTEYLAFAVRADSVLRSAADLLERARVDSASLSVALSTSLGNPNHVALARIVQHAGGDPGAPLVRVFDSAPDAVADVISGKSELAVVTAASTSHALASGHVRLLALSSPQRLPGTFAAVPTWGEYSVPCEVGAWRGVAGAAGIGESHIAYWRRTLGTAIATATWRSEIARHGWADCHIEGPSLHAYLEKERREMTAALNELGLIRADAPFSGRKTTERDV